MSFLAYKNQIITKVENEKPLDLEINRIVWIDMEVNVTLII